MRLIIKRNKAYVGCAMSYRIKINGQDAGMISNGKTVALACPDQPFELHVVIYGNSMNVHSIEARTMIDPRQSRTGDIFVDINSKMNFLGVLTSGLFAPVGKMALSVRYA